MSRSMRSSLGWALASVMIVGCSPGPVPLSTFGQRCAVDDECESGLCRSSIVGSICTQACSPTEACPGSSDYVCGPEGICQLACSEGSTSGVGAARMICVDGLEVACSTRDAAADCDVCGCDPFGGGVCVAGTGCVVPGPDGQECALNAECSSGACYRDTLTCGPPRAQGEACRADAECATGNCSSDGDETVAGVCNQELGTECSGSGNTATCTNCLQYDRILPGVCTRARCGPTAGCPQLGHEDRVWTCEEATDGTNRCFERCTDSGYRCFDSLRSCRSGFCG